MQEIRASKKSRLGATNHTEGMISLISYLREWIRGFYKYFLFYNQTIPLVAYEALKSAALYAYVQPLFGGVYYRRLQPAVQTTAKSNSPYLNEE
jgi:hypothetical protein